MADSDYLMVAAIDFGTTFSGYAFSMKNSPEEIIMNKNWGENVGFAAYKKHTSVLTKENGTVVDFGLDAEHKYYGEQEDDEDDDDKPKPVYYLYRHFKMILHKTAKLGLHTQIMSVDGVHRGSAITIFSGALEYLKNHLLDALEKSLTRAPEAKDIRWVVTVPAIWTEESKQFMREAAFRAGCIESKDSRQLVIALEPEAASLCCRRLDIANYPDGTNLSIEPGTKYLVIDCGGGTVDITAHEVLGDRSIRELHSATGGAWGGTKVDANFEQLMKDVLGRKFIDEFKKRCPQQWFTFMIKFETLKKAVSLHDQKSMNIQLSYGMDNEYKSVMGKGKSIREAIKASKGKGVKFNFGNIVISHETAVGLFKPVVENINDHVEKILKEKTISGTKLFFLVGGFSESSILQEILKKRFEGRVQILIPSEAQMAVVKGAVLFGHKPEEIKSRVMRYTYGYGCNERINDESKFDMTKSFYQDDILYCRDIFVPFVQKNNEVDVGEERKRTVVTMTADQKLVRIQLFRLDREPYPREYTDARGVEKMGEFHVETPGHGKDRPVDLSITFGGTEIQIKGQASGEPTTAKIDFMTN